MSAPKMPWDSDYVPPSVDADLIAATTAVNASPAPSSPPEENVLPPEATGPVVAPTSTPPTGGIHVPVTGTKGVREEVLEVAKEAAESAVRDLAKAMQDDVLNAIKNTLPPDTPPHIDPGDLLKASARSRAIRTFFGGLLVTMAWAVITALGSAANVDWFTKEGLASVAILAGSSVITAVISYVARVFAPPPLVQVPGGG